MTGTTVDFSDIFLAFIADRTKDFTGREWVFAEIDHWLADPKGPSFFIITGEPGVGKSAIAARLTQIRGLAAYHFCIARQANTTDPVLFARSLSQQLCRIDSFALGILKDSDVDLKITQQVQGNYGQMIGARIENLILHAPSGVAAFTHAVLEPLRSLYAGGYDQPVVILVDALDEAVQHQGSETIVDLLANVGALPRPVRLVLTSRPEGAALRHFAERRIPHFRLDANRPENLQDIRRYVVQQLSASAALRDRVASQRMPEASFVERIATASLGNFLYLVWLLPAIAAGTQRFDALETLPQGLDGIYRELLRTRKTADEAQWRRVYEPILGVLAAAQAPLTRDALAQFAGIAAREVRFGLHDLNQFLDPASADEGRYFLYHQSIKDWLQDEARSQEFWVDVTPVHQNIVRTYHQDAPSWDDLDWDAIDPYGLDHLASHLFALRDDPVYRHLLYGLACRSVMAGKRRRTGAQRAFAADMDLALKAAIGEAPVNWLETARAAVIYATLGSLASTVSPAMLGALAACGQAERALAYAAIVQDAQQRFDSYLRIGAAMIAQPQAVRADEVFKQALWAAESIQYDWARSYALSQIAQALAQAGQPEVALPVAESIQDDSARSDALSQIAQALAQAGQPELALRAAESIQDVSARSDALRQIAQALAQASQPELALRAAESIQDVSARSSALRQIAQALAQGDQPEQAVTALELALRAAESIQGQPVRTIVLIEIVQTLGVLAQAGQPELALPVAESIQDERAKSSAFRRIAQALTQAGEPEQASHVAESIWDERVRPSAPRQIAQALAQASQPEQAATALEQALRAAESIQVDWIRSDALSQIAQALAQAGKQEQAATALEQALRAVESIQDPWDRSQALNQIAQVLGALAQAGQPGLAATALKQALRVAEGIQNAQARSRALSQIARALGVLAQAGQPEQALRVAELIQDAATKSEALSRVAQARADAGQLRPAAQLAQRALATALGVRGREAKAEAFDLVAEVLVQLAQAGLADRALELVERYLGFSEELRRERGQDLMEIALARGLASAGRCSWVRDVAQGAASTYLRALAGATTALCFARAQEMQLASAFTGAAVSASLAVVGSKDRVDALTQTARVVYQLGQAKGAQGLVDLASSTTDPVKPAHQRALMASQVASAFVALQRPAEAARLAAVAREAARAVRKPATAIDCLARAAVALADAGQRDEGLRELEQATTLAAQLSDGAEQALAWSRLARALLALGETVQAAELLNTAQTALADDGRQQPTAIQAHLAHSLALAGRRDQALALLQSALLQARYVDRASVLEVLTEGAPLLADIDNGETLWQLYQAIREIDGWWGLQPDVEARSNTPFLQGN